MRQALFAGLDLQPHRIADGVFVTISQTRSSWGLCCWEFALPLSKEVSDGRIGRIVGYDAVRKQYLIRVQGNAFQCRAFRLTVEKLTQHCIVDLPGGKEGCICAYNPERGFAIAGGSQDAFIPAQDVRLKKGTFVTAQGLTSEEGSRLNGQGGVILSVEDNGRYIVSFNRAVQVALKPTNVKP